MIFFFLLVSVLFWFSPALAEDFYLEYRVSWSFITVGKVEVWKRERGALAYAQTVGLGALLLPFKALWRTRTDTQGYPLKSEIEILERGRPKRKVFWFYPDEGVILKEKITPEKYRRQALWVSFPLFDELTGFLKALFLDWSSPKKPYVLPIFAGKKVHPARLSLKAVRHLKTFRGEEEVLEIEVELSFESELLKRSRKIILYLSRDRWPVMLKGKITLGHLTARLLRVSTSKAVPPPPETLLHSDWPASD